MHADTKATNEMFNNIYIIYTVTIYNFSDIMEWIECVF